MAVQYEQVASLTHIGKNGSTLADLRLGASQLGLAAVVKKGNLQDLEASSLPVVAHLEDSSGNPERIGHFVLVMSINRSANTLTMFDGTSGTYSEVSVPEFFRQWSGYFLSTKPPYEWLPKAGIAILSLAILFAISQLRRKPAL
jgi:ABC-type bacteriocin/lantibiotic exporter with double-glycine peptidase domain